MVKPQDLAELTAISTAAALDSRLWKRFLERASAIVGPVRSHIVSFGADASTIGFMHHGYDTAFQKSYLEYYGEINAWAPGIVALRENEVADSRQICPEAILSKTEWYNGWVRPQDDIMLGGGGQIVKRFDGTFFIGGNIPRSAGEDVSDTWLALLRLLMPQLRNVWEISQALTAERLGIGNAASFLVRPDHRLVFLNAAATALLTEGRSLGLDARGRLIGRDAEVDFWLGDVLSRLRAGGFGSDEFKYAVGPETVTRFRGIAFNSDLIGRTWPLGCAQYLGPCLLLTVSPDTSSLSGDAHLARQLGITEAEANVARALASGLSPRQIADDRSVSIHTVRNQLKSAMSKCGVRRQTQLTMVVDRAGRTRSLRRRALTGRMRQAR